MGDPQRGRGTHLPLVLYPLGAVGWGLASSDPIATHLTILQNYQQINKIDRLTPVRQDGSFAGSSIPEKFSSEKNCFHWKTLSQSLGSVVSTGNVSPPSLSVKVAMGTPLNHLRAQKKLVRALGKQQRDKLAYLQRPRPPTEGRRKLTVCS